MFEIAVIEDAAAAEVSLDPVRARLLAELAEPGTATTLAARLGLPRQRINYHLKTLEQHGLVELVEERRKGNVTERLLRATAAVLRDLAGRAGARPAGSDALARPAVGVLAARARRTPGARCRASDPGAAKARKRVATSRSTARSASPRPPTARRSPKSLAETVAALIGNYHDATAAGGRDHRVIVAIHPKVPAAAPQLEPKES